MLNFFNKIENYFAQNHPVLWMTKLYYVLPVLLLYFFVAIFLGVQAPLYKDRLDLVLPTIILSLLLFIGYAVAVGLFFYKNLSYTQYYRVFCIVLITALGLSFIMSVPCITLSLRQSSINKAQFDNEMMVLQKGMLVSAVSAFGVRNDEDPYAYQADYSDSASYSVLYNSSIFPTFDRTEIENNAYAYETDSIYLQKMQKAEEVMQEIYKLQETPNDGSENFGQINSEIEQKYSEHEKLQLDAYSYRDTLEQQQRKLHFKITYDEVLAIVNDLQAQENAVRQANDVIDKYRLDFSKEGRGTTLRFKEGQGGYEQVAQSITGNAQRIINNANDDIVTNEDTTIVLVMGAIISCIVAILLMGLLCLNLKWIVLLSPLIFLGVEGMMGVAIDWIFGGSKPILLTFLWLITFSVVLIGHFKLSARRFPTAKKLFLLLAHYCLPLLPIALLACSTSLLEGSKAPVVMFVITIMSVGITFAFSSFFVKRYHLLAHQPRD